jgi:hypothetical protein
MAAVTRTVASRLPGDGTRTARKTPAPQHLTEDELHDLLRDGAPADVADVLLALPEATRRSLADAIRTGDATEPALLIAGAACLPRADAIVTWLRSRRFREIPSAETLAELIAVLSAPGRPRLTSVAAVMADRMRPRSTWPGEWPIARAVFLAAGITPPATEPVLRAWIRSHTGDPATLAERLTSDPWLDHLLPHVFDIPGLDRHWPPALVELTASGRLDRNHLLGIVLHRLRAEGSAAALRPAATTHDLLCPTPDETAERGEDYPAPRAELSRHALDSAKPTTGAAREKTPPQPESEAAPATRTGISGETWTAPEPKPQPPAADQRPAPRWSALGAGGPRAAQDRPAHAAGRAGPDSESTAVGRAIGPLGLSPRALAPGPRAIVPAGPGPRAVAPLFPAAPVRVVADAMPAPFESVAELVGELTIRITQPLEPVSLERILAGLVAFAQADRDELVAAVSPLADEAPAPYGVLLRTLVRPGRIPEPQPADPLSAMVTSRMRELAQQLATIAPPALLATPISTDGVVSPVRMLFRLLAAERDGWQPGPYDLAQALLRLPDVVDPTVTIAADRLVSSAGRQFAAWLRSGGLPPVTTTVVPGSPRRATLVPAAAPTLPQDAAPEPAPDGVPPLLHDPAPAATVDSIIRDLLTPPGPDPDAAARPEMRCWPMVLPHHRDVVAAHCVPFAIAEERSLAGIYGGLARSSGAFGPAMALVLARGLVSRAEDLRTSAADAVLHLAGTGGLDAALIGREMRALDAGPAAGSLRRIGEGRAWHVVWAIAYAVVPALLRQRPVPDGMPDLLAVAADAAAAIGARADLPDVTVAAAEPGRTELSVEATRLAQIIR